jgi:uncharacterized LabA/DUF88 family protein
MAYVGFVDAGYLKEAGARALGVNATQLRPVAAAVVDWFKQLATFAADQELLRIYWYEGQYDPRHPAYQRQRTFLDMIAGTPGIQLRAGHLAERPPKGRDAIRYAVKASARHFGIDADSFLADFEQRFQFLPQRQQKGVDTLITLDLVSLGQQAAYQTAVLIAGDRDLAEAVRAAQAMGRRVIVAHPKGDGIATELRQLADHVHPITASDVGKMLQHRPGSVPPRTAP